MRIGVSLPNLGLSANPDALIRGAQHAERIGFDTLWVADRLLYPVRPRNPYPATQDGSLPDYYRSVLAPLESMAFAAGVTNKIALGSSVIGINLYNPVVLARALTTIDVLSRGRLIVGFGLGWSEDEFEAAGTPPKGRGGRADEFLQILKAVWTSDPVEFNGKFFKLARSFIGPKPVQKPHPPIYMAAYTSAALKRVATYADGWQPNGGILLGRMPQMLEELRATAKAAGRDPSSLKLNVVASTTLTADRLDDTRAYFTGSIAQVRDDITRARDLGTTELIFELDLTPPVDTLIIEMDRLRRLVD